jgi:hypothetical protein
VRRAAALLLGALACASAVGAEPGLPRRLDRAALEALAHENPAHYLRIQKLLRARGVVGDERLAGCVGVSFDARRVLFSQLLLTTYPAQRDLSFALDDVAYVMRVEARDTSRFLAVEAEPGAEAPCPR